MYEKIITRPDPERPDSYFQHSYDSPMYIVAVMAAQMKPSWLDLLTSGIGGAAYYGIAQVLTGGTRRGYKVIVNRRAKWRPWPSTLRVDFFEQLEPAEERQKQILAEWKWQEWKTKPDLTRHELREGWHAWKANRSVRE